MSDPEWGESYMVVKFVPEPCKPFGPDDGSAVPAVPQQLLERHGGRMLNPAEVVVAAGDPRPRSTVYRAGTMLIPNDILRDQRTIARFNEILHRIDLDLVPPPETEDSRRFERLPRPVQLKVWGEAAEPGRVDSWPALQALRAAFAKDTRLAGIVDRVSVEHLLFGTVDIGGTPWEASGAPGDSGYVRTGTTGRIPVTYFGPPPPRRGLDRRPVVAVLDTGIGPNKWFGLPNRTTPPAAGGFLSVFPALQDAIRDQQLQAGLTNTTQILQDYWDSPVTDNPLVGKLDRDTGHGTFIAGIIRQAAPEANVLAIRVLHSDGVAYEGDVLLALWRLVARVQQAQNGKPEDMIDVVSLSLGYFDETNVPSAFTGQLVEVIDKLRQLGVLVVAAAGNDATTRRFYPAALAERPDTGLPQVISVGALNPNNSKALFSNEAPWVRCWATGAAIVSTFPNDLQGSVASDSVPKLGRAALDPDDYTAGFAVWDGTSFAAPLAAAVVTAAMIKCAEADPTIGLKAIDKAVAVQRARAALKEVSG